MTKNIYGKLPARFIVMDALTKGLTSKETAFASGYSLRSLHEAARRMGKSFPSNGIGRPPKRPTR